MTRRTLAAAFGAVALIGAGLLSYVLAERAALRNLGRAAQDRLSLLERTLDYTVGRFSYLPDVLSQAAPIIEAYRNPSDPRAIRDANLYLKSLNETAGSADLYIVDRNGVALAASNFDREATFVGQNYAFRPYFTDALTTGEGRYYAVGVTTGQPGYFLWHAVPDADGSTIGVAVVKIDLLHLQEDWKSAGDIVAMVDANEVIFLTSHPDWQYRPMTRLSADQIRMFRETQQYGGAVLKASPLLSGEREVDGVMVENVDDGSVTGHEYVAFSRTLPQYGWTLLVLSDMRNVQLQAGIAAGGAVVTVIAAFLIVLVSHQRRQIARAKLNAHALLEQRVAARTAELTAANTQLSVEIDQRIRIEQNLRRAQDNLVHATKMASLGQALAGVAHEINQSLSALRTYIASTQVFLSRADKELASGNLNTISSIVERMGELTQHLKSFARKETVAKQSTDLTAAIRYGLKLIDYRITADDVQLSVILPGRPVYVLGNTIRLEQVVVNLVSNALDAMRDHPHRHLTVELIPDGSSAVLEVTDTGRGIAREQLSSVFDPFYTTKDVGEGLGLGLSISYGIVKDMGGEISVESELNVGTTFRVTLPRAAEVASSAEVSA
ncbi:MAG: ATP-binding protein [Rhodospirillaceae bacterium]